MNVNNRQYTQIRELTTGFTCLALANSVLVSCPPKNTSSRPASGSSASAAAGFLDPADQIRPAESGEVANGFREGPPRSRSWRTSARNSRLRCHAGTDGDRLVPAL